MHATKTFSQLTSVFMKAKRWNQPKCSLKDEWINEIRILYIQWILCLHAKLLQSCLTLWNLIDYTPSASSVHGILQAWTLEWVAMPSSRVPSPSRDWTQVSYSLLHCQVGSLSLGPPGKPHNEYYSELIRKEILTPAAKPWRHCTKLNKPAIKGKTLWKWKCLSRVWLFATPSWSIQSMEFPRPEYWSG